MAEKDAENRMLSQALRLISQVEDMRRLGFDLGSVSAWEPPLDLIETQTEIVAYVALPGVEISEVEITTDDGVLVLNGRRQRPPEWRTAGILRVELPWGPFERRVRIPHGCRLVARQATQGYLVIRLSKPAEEEPQ